VGKFGFTTHFEARLARPVRIGVEAEARGTLKKRSSRVVKSQVVVSQAGLPCFTGDFTFVLMDLAAAEKLMGTTMPEAWARYCR
jgi:acyl-coenzyme A thioesterase PaaI-like protein